MIWSYVNGIRTAIEITDDPSAKADSEQAESPPVLTMEERMETAESDLSTIKAEVEDISYIIQGKKVEHAQ